MIIQTNRMVSSFLGNTTYGVNAQINSLTLDSGDTTPPQLLGIYDATTDSRVALKQLPTVFPSLIVQPYQQHILVPMVGTVIRYGTVHIVISYYNNNTDAPTSLSSGLYTLQAIERSLRAFMENGQASFRIKGNVGISGMSGLSFENIYNSVGDGNLLCAATVAFDVREDFTGLL